MKNANELQKHILLINDLHHDILTRTPGEDIEVIMRPVMGDLERALTRLEQTVAVLRFDAES